MTEDNTVKHASSMLILIPIGMVLVFLLVVTFPIIRFLQFMNRVVRGDLAQ